MAGDRPQRRGLLEDMPLEIDEPSDHEQQANGYLNAYRFSKRTRILLAVDGPPFISQGTQGYANQLGEQGERDNEQSPQRRHLRDLRTGCCRHLLMVGARHTNFHGTSVPCGVYGNALQLRLKCRASSVYRAKIEAVSL